jgi:hypothetical protein
MLFLAGEEVAHRTCGLMTRQFVLHVLPSEVSLAAPPQTLRSVGRNGSGLLSSVSPPVNNRPGPQLGNNVASQNVRCRLDLALNKTRIPMVVVETRTGDHTTCQPHCLACKVVVLARGG